MMFQPVCLKDILSDRLFNNFNNFVRNANVHTFWYDNALSDFVKKITLIAVLECASFVALIWFQTNKLVVNPEKVQSTRIYKMKQSKADKIVKTGEKSIEDFSSAKLFRSSNRR